jgi:hypothetical protein
MTRPPIVRHPLFRKYATTAALLAAFVLPAGTARAGVAVRIDIGNAPHSSRVFFRSRPRERFYAGERVYVIEDAGDYDCFRYGGWYWVFEDGYWYRARTWRGRFFVVDPVYVPDFFYRMPPSRWRHRPDGPPQHMRPMRDGLHDRGRMPGGRPGMDAPHGGNGMPMRTPPRIESPQFTPRPQPPRGNPPHMNPPQEHRPPERVQPPQQQRRPDAPARDRGRPNRPAPREDPKHDQKKHDQKNDRGEQGDHHK